MRQHVFRAPSTVPVLVEKKHSVLLCGPLGSGKRTLLKQMKILYDTGFSPKEQQQYRVLIRRRLLHSISSTIADCQKAGFELLESTQAAVGLLHSFMATSSQESPTHQGPLLSSELLHAVYQLRGDPATRQVFSLYSARGEREALHLFSRAERISEEGYTPSNEDILEVSGMIPNDTGLIQVPFTWGYGRPTLLICPQQRFTDRNKWMHLFDEIESLVYCTDISRYASSSTGDSHLLRSIALFSQLINSPFFSRTTIIFLMNKIDNFRAMIAIDAFQNHFPDCPGNDINSAAKYILRRFMSTNEARLSVYPYLMQTNDTDTVRMTLAAVRDTVFQVSFAHQPFM